jgi:hypothetical protein
MALLAYLGMNAHKLFPHPQAGFHLQIYSGGMVIVIVIVVVEISYSYLAVSAEYIRAELKE